MNHMTVLVTDDNATSRKLLRAQLEAEGITVAEAPDGREALAVLHRQSVDAIISDVLMPRMDGFRLCYEVRNAEPSRDLPFIIYTSTYLSAADEKLALELGADRYLRKPAPAAALLDALKEAAAGSVRRPAARLTEADVLKEYSERLVRKLEEKNTELETAQAELQTANAQLEQRVRDRTAELESANLKLQTAKERAEMADRAKTAFLATMSHELRTPLNAIIGFTGTMIMKIPGPLNPEQEKQLRTVQSSAKHLLSLINDLLDLAKVESGKVELHFEPVLCQSAVQEVATALRPAAESKGLKFELNVPVNEVVVQTDRRALNQILLNLANNAVKFTECGSVRLELAQHRTGDRTLTQFTVADSGVGIRVEDQAKLFQAFGQVGPGAKRRHEGTGLGLHLSQKLAELLGGQITVESEFGKGSRFTLVLGGG